jgi:aquaporin Z
MGVIFFAEFFGSFLLVMTVLNAGTSANNEGNSFYGLAIGGSLVVSALVFGNISGAVLNPAVGMLALFGFVHEGKGVPAASWVFFVAPMVASGCAGDLLLFCLSCF